MMKLDLSLFAGTARQPTEFTCTCLKMTLTVDTLAEKLNISCSTTYALADRKDFPSFRVRRRLLVNRALLQEWTDQNCHPRAKAGCGAKQMIGIRFKE